MKKYYLLILFLLVMTTTWATGIYRLPITIHQADGTALTLIGHGDENFHWSTTTDGVILAKSGDNFYVAIIDDNGKIKPSRFLAHNKDKRSSEENAAIAQQDRLLFNQVAEETLAFHRSVKKASIEKNANRPYTPHTGNVRGIVILVETADTLFSLPNPKKSFEYYFNGDHADATDFTSEEFANAGSVNKYFNDISFGKFNPTFDVYGPIKLKDSTCYYSKQRHQLVSDACKAADGMINFADPIYDSDGDGVVDVVSVVYAGYSASYVGSSDLWIWPCANGTNIGKFDGAQVFRWIVSNELIGYPGAFAEEPLHRINGIGIFCHEFSHCLGLPDIYPTNTDARIDNQEMEYWDIMDGGEYLSNGYFPPAYTAWERETMGWMTVDTLSTDQKGIILKTVDSRDGKAYRFMNPNDKNKREYMMIENIQNKGWNYAQRGHGLLVYHVNYSSDTVNVFDHPNNVKGIPRMAVVPADGLLLSSYNLGLENYINPETGVSYTVRDYIDQHAGDPFPGSKGVTSLRYDMGLPNFKWYVGDAEVKQALLNISEDTSNGIVTFDYITDITNGISRTIVSENVGKDGDNRIFTIDGRMVNAYTPLPKGIYIQGGRKFVVR